MNIDRVEYYKPVRDEFLVKIAPEIEKLLVKPENRKCFERYACEFRKELALYGKTYRLRLQEKVEYRKKSFRNKNLRNKNRKNPPKGYVWYDDSPLETGVPGFWGPPPRNKLLPDPQLKLRPAPKGIAPRNEDEALEKYFVLLTIIHDFTFKSFTPIARLGKFIEIIDHNLVEEGQSTIEIALEYVKSYLNRLPVQPASGNAGETKQKKTRKKTPPQFLKETRERQAAKELANNPEITAEELGKILDCNKSTVVRLKAWQNKGVLANPLPPNGFKKQDDKGRTDTEAIGENEPNNETENL